MVIRLDRRRNKFYYSAEEHKHGGFLAKATGKIKECSFSDFISVLYGGQTMSFGRHKKRLVKHLKRQNEGQQN